MANCRANSIIMNFCYENRHLILSTFTISDLLCQNYEFTSWNFQLRAKISECHCIKLLIFSWNATLWSTLVSVRLAVHSKIAESDFRWPSISPPICEFTPETNRSSAPCARNPSPNRPIWSNIKKFIKKFQSNQKSAKKPFTFIDTLYNFIVTYHFSLIFILYGQYFH